MIFWLPFYLCPQTADDTRQFLKLYDPDLGRPLPERTYAEDCRIYTPGHPNGSFAIIMDKMDVFVPSHFFGWWVKVCSSSLSTLCLFFLPLSFFSLPPSPSPTSPLFPHLSSLSPQWSYPSTLEVALCVLKLVTPFFFLLSCRLSSSAMCFSLTF